MVGCIVRLLYDRRRRKEIWEWKNEEEINLGGIMSFDVFENWGKLMYYVVERWGWEYGLYREDSFGGIIVC